MRIQHEKYGNGRVIEVHGVYIQILFDGETQARKFHKSELIDINEEEAI